MINDDMQWQCSRCDFSTDVKKETWQSIMISHYEGHLGEMNRKSNIRGGFKTPKLQRGERMTECNCGRGEANLLCDNEVKFLEEVAREQEHQNLLNELEEFVKLKEIQTNDEIFLTDKSQYMKRGSRNAYRKVLSKIQELKEK